ESAEAKGLASRIYENPLLPLVGQADPVHFEKRARRGVVQPGKDELREAGLVEATWRPAADREEQNHRLHLEPPGNERQHLRRRPIKPMRILDHEQQRRLPLALGNQAEGCQPYQEGVRRIALGDSECHLEGPSLRIRTVIHAIQEREQQLMQPSEGKPRLRRRSHRRHYGRALPEGPFPDSFEQRRLTDSCFATDNEGTATPPDLIDHSEEALQLPISP